jgi:hypothetical protein
MPRTSASALVKFIQGFATASSMVLKPAGHLRVAKEAQSLFNPVSSEK